MRTATLTAPAARWSWPPLLRASVALPGILPPVTHHGHLLVDGGVMNNLPVDVMRGLRIRA